MDSHHKSRRERRSTGPKDYNKLVNPHKLINTYVDNPVGISKLLKMKEFKKDVCIEKTTFEEIEIFQELMAAYEPTKQEINDITKSSGTISDAVNNIFIETLSRHEDKTTALTSFHMLLYKRLQIITKFQFYLQIKFENMTKAKQDFTQIKSSTIKKMDPSQQEIVKQLEKDLQKKDIRKGIFGKLKTARYKAIYKTLQKSVKRHSLKGCFQSLQRIHEYAFKFTKDKKNRKSQREKTLKTLIFIAIGTGDLFAILEVLCLIIEFSDNPLNDSIQEEDAISIKPEDTRLLGGFSDEILGDFNGITSVLHKFLTNKNYLFDKSVTKKSCKQLFMFLLSHIELVSEAFILKRRKSMDNPKMYTEGLWNEYSLQPTPQSIQSLLYLLDKIAFEENINKRFKNEDKVDVIMALLKILRLNISVLVKWKKTTESVGILISRLGGGEANCIMKTQQMLYKLLQELNKITNNSPRLSALADVITSIIVDGFNLFFPTTKSQSKYFLTIIPKVVTSIVDQMIVNKVMHRLVHDSLFFYSFILQGLSLQEGGLTDFFEKVLEVVKSQIFAFTSKGHEIKPIMKSLMKNSLTVLLIWLHELSRKISPAYTKFQIQVNQTSTFKSPDGTKFMSMCKLILKSSVEILKNFPGGLNNPEEISTALKDSVVGRLLFPLLQIVIRLLWKNDNRVKYNLYCLTSFLYPYLLQLFSEFSRLNTLLKNKEKVFEYYIAETDHPYIGGLKEKITVNFNKNKCVSSGIIFHPRTRTANKNDTLIISVPHDSNDTQPIKISGVGNTIPTNPLISSGNEIHLTFNSSEQQTDWGVKFSVLPILKIDWMFEIEKYIGWLGGRFSSYVISAFPYSVSEKKNFKLLNSRLFFNGLGGTKEDKISNNIEKFLGEIITGEGEGGSLAKYMYHRLRGESFLLGNNNEVITAEKHLISVIIKHTGVIGTSISFAKEVIANEDDYSVLFARVPPELIQVWRSARVIRTWMAQKKQTKEIPYPEIKDSIIKKTSFLKELNSCSYSRYSDEELLEIINKSIKKEEIDDNMNKMTIRTNSTSSVSQFIKELSAEIVEFVQSEDNLDSVSLKKVLKMRTERASCRQKGFDMYTAFLSRTNYNSVKAEIVRTLFSVLTSVSFKKGDSIDFHYFNNVENGGSEMKSRLMNSFHLFLKKLLEKVSFSDDSVIRSGLVRSTLTVCIISFKASDFKWVLDLNILERLTPLLYAKDEGEEGKEKRFQKRKSITEEVLICRNLAWKFIRLLSVRCIDILNDWEEGTKYQYPHNEQNEMKKRMDALRDRIFQLVFDRFEKMIKKNESEIQPSVIVEMLNLMVPLCNNQSGQTTLSSSRFQKMVIPLLKLNIPKVQELSLSLYGQLLFAGGNKEESITFKATFINTLFGLLGSYTMCKVFGRNIFNENTTVVGLNLAKEIFCLIRKLLKPDSPQAWKTPITVLLEQYIKEGEKLLKLAISKDIRSLIQMERAEKKKIKYILASIVLVCGLEYIPITGEYVKARLHGRWEDAKIVFVEESRLSVKIALKESCGIDQNQKVDSNNIRVLTNEVILGNQFRINKEIITSLLSIIKLYGKLLFSEESNYFDVNFHLFFSFVWSKTLKLVHEKIIEKELVNYLDSKLMVDIINISKNTTPIKYGKELKLCTCSYTFTGKKAIPQVLYRCYTCKLPAEKAICSFCAKTCHRGHHLGRSNLSSHYCDCGCSNLGKGNKPCISLQIPPDDPSFGLRRAECFSVRLRSFMPIHASRSEVGLSFMGKSGENQQSFLSPSQFVNVSSTGYVINQRNNQISFKWNYAKGFSMVGTDHPVPSNYSGYYYEIEILSFGGKQSGICFGFTERVNKNMSWPEVLKDSYSYHIESDKLFVGEKFYQAQSVYSPLRTSDIYGCGWNKDNKTIYFTKNGELLTVKVPNVPSNKYYPMIVIRGDKGVVRTNLGSHKFKYHVNKNKKVDLKPSKSLTFTKISSTESLSKKIIELSSLGYNENNCKQALAKYSDLNSAAAYLHRRAMRPRRFKLSDSLVSMGFDRPLAIKALELCGDDVNSALNWLLEEHGPAMHQPGGGKEIYPDRGIPFLGSNIDKLKVHDETMKGLLNSQATKINQNNFTNIRKKNYEKNSFVVVNPYFVEDPNSTTNCSQMKGLNGVIVRNVEQGAYVQSLDQEEGTFIQSFVPVGDLIAPCEEFKKLKLSDVPEQSIEHNKYIGILFSRKLLRHCLKTESEIIMKNSFLNSKNMYETLKVLFMNQLKDQNHIFIANTLHKSEGLENMLENLDDMKVVLDNGEKELFFNVLAQNALDEIAKFQEGMPFYRKVIFKNDYNNKRIQIRFWGASSIFISFSNKCILESKYDQLTIHYGREKITFMGPQNTSPNRIPRYVVIPGDRFWFEFRATRIKEGTGFQFHITPTSFRLTEKQALVQPNIGLAGTVLQNTTNEFWKKNIMQAKKTFEISSNYLMTPFAPFKGILCNAMESLIHELYLTHEHKPNLNIVKAFRVELEDLFISFKRRSETTDLPLPIFHSLVELMCVFRNYVSTDLCRSVFPYQDCNQHMYSIKYTDQKTQRVKDIITCTSCSMNKNLKGSGTIPAYHAHVFAKCGVNFSKHFEWVNSFEKEDFSNLMPYKELKVSVQDWFEHTSWVDQLTVVRSLLKIFVGAAELPDWILFDAAVEILKKQVFRESSHPYNTLHEEGEIELPSSKVLYITFDKHTHTDSTDFICFSRNKMGGTDLGMLSGDKLKDKTFKIFTSKLFYQFRCNGGDHKMRCCSCNRAIVGVRYHCCHPECDDYELCEFCINRSGVHPEDHIFLKIRRPMDWQPASIPILYTRRWRQTQVYKRNVHKGYKCDHCGMDPIVGVRWWCENCPNFNLCGRCGDKEYKYHNRLHVFLRVFRPLPSSKKKLPANHLPYGLVYEKDPLWGFLFKVSNEEKFSYEDSKIKDLMKEMKKCMKKDNWTYEKDKELIQYIETYQKCSWQAIRWDEITPTKDELLNYPLLSRTELKSIRYRFVILKLLNQKVDRTLNLMNLEAADFKMQKSFTNLSTMLSLTRGRIFYTIKKDVWDNTLTKTTIEIKNGIDLKLNRKVAADAKSSTNKIHAAFNSLFIQSYNQVQAFHPQVLSRKKGAWKVTFLGEQADDYGGLFRESISQMCTELQSEQLDLFIRVPNQQHGVGENREKFMPNPRARSYLHMKWYYFVGMLMGVGMLSKNELSLDLPSIFWKKFVKQKITVKDLEGIDQMVYQSMENLRNIQNQGITKETFDDVIMENFTTIGSDGVEVELVKAGKIKPVTWENRMEYANLVENYRVNEVSSQVNAIRSGLFSVVPSRFSSIFAWNEFEKIICGEKMISLETLKEHTIYEDYKKTDRAIIYFWKVFESFNSQERSLYLRFVWGRSRLPVTEEGYTHQHKIQRLDRPYPNKVLPLSHTCFFSIELPNYSSEKILREKLLYAISNCRAIDTDVTRNARSALNME